MGYLKRNSYIWEQLGQIVGEREGQPNLYGQRNISGSGKH